MFDVLKSALFKIKDYDKLYDELSRYKMRIDDLEVYIKHLEIKLSEEEKDLYYAKEELDKLEKKVNFLDLPKNSLRDLEKKLELSDNYTLKIIIDFLVLDTYELVKNIASRINKDNIDNFISYRDGAIARNEELKKLLEKYVKKKDVFVDRIAGEEKKKK